MVLDQSIYDINEKGMPACGIKRQMEHSRYSTVLSVMHRIRDLMGKRDNLYRLNDMVEFDEGYFETEVSEKVRSNLKRGKGDCLYQSRNRMDLDGWRHNRFR